MKPASSKATHKQHNKKREKRQEKKIIYKFMDFNEIKFKCLMLNGKEFNNQKFITMNQILYNITIDDELFYYLFQYDTSIYFYFRKGDIFYYSFIYENESKVIKQIYNQFIKHYYNLLKIDLKEF